MHLRAIVLGNALGNSIVSKMSGPPTPVVAAASGSGEAGSSFDGSGYRNSAIDNLRLEDLGEPSLSNNPTDAVYQPDATRYTARRGDSISEIVGTSDPVAIEAFMRANNLSDSTIYAGREYVLPGEADYAASTGQLGQATLNADNTRLAEYAAREQLAAEARGLGYFDEQLTRSLNAPSRAIPMAGGSTLPEMDHSSYVAPGFVASAYYSAAAEAENSNNSFGTRAVNFGLAVAAAPLALLDEAGRAIMNIPYAAGRVGQDLAIINLSSDRDTQILAGLDAVSFGAQAFTAAGSVVPVGQAGSVLSGSALGLTDSAVTTGSVSRFSQLRQAATFLRDEAQIFDQLERRRVIASFGPDLEVGFVSGQAYQYSGLAGTGSRYLTPVPLADPIRQLALPPGNPALLLQQYSVAPTRALIGTVAPQNFGVPLPGGATQIFVPSRSVLTPTPLLAKP